MWAIVGLGNPGTGYSRTRHNIGFMVVDAVAVRHKIELKEKRHCLSGTGAIDGAEAVLIKPLTFMNRSGLAVGEALRKFNVPPERLIVIHDDMDMETGKLKIKKNGSSGGHNGVESVIESIGTMDFVRIKIGIGRDMTIPAEDYVLSRFKRAELPLIKAAIKTASDAVGTIVNEAIENAMNRFNRRSGP
ncbi:MAG: aminoacyl-tRNA hydrolase [Thermodesulfovibrionales bacterium]|nr:aminoacyl-tRNA hydrolase [Thermodesulfovibrionales bacterium]